VSDEDLAFAGLGTLARLLSQRKVSSLELTELALARLERFGPTYGAVVTIMHDRARSAAKRADRERAAGTVRSPLHGIPYGAKDLLAATGAPTTWGAAPFRDQRFNYDATTIAKLSSGGAVLTAKLAMIELAGGFGYDDADASFTGPGRTPWNRNYWSGGSSSGSGAAVSAGLVPFAIGSETSGSIVYPATLCGVTGLRPTFGRVSRHGAMALCWSLDKLGPLSRTPSDALTVLRVIAGADAGDVTAETQPFPPLRRRPRVGVIAKSTRKIMPAIRANFEATLKVLAEYCDLVDGVPFPDFPYGDAATAIVNAEGASAFRDVIESGKSRELQSSDDRVGGYEAYATLAVDYVDACRLRRPIIDAFEKSFSSFDAIVAPTTVNVAYPIGVKFSVSDAKYDGAGVDSISAGNLAGVPAIALPNGFAPENLPTGVTFIGRPWCEAKLVQIATEYQRRTTFHLRRPPLAGG